MVLQSAAAVLAEKCGAGKDLFNPSESKESVLVHCTQVADVRLKVDREAIDVPNVVGWYPGTDENISASGLTSIILGCSAVNCIRALTTTVPVPPPFCRLPKPFTRGQSSRVAACC